MRKHTQPTASPPLQKSEQEWRAELTPEQYDILRRAHWSLDAIQRHDS